MQPRSLLAGGGARCAAPANPHEDDMSEQSGGGELLHGIDEPAGSTIKMSAADPHDGDGTDGTDGDGTDGADSDGTDGAGGDSGDDADGTDGDGTDGTDGDSA